MDQNGESGPATPNSRERILSRREALAALAGGVLTAGSVGCMAGGDQASGAGDRSPLHYLSLMDVAALLEAGEISSVELTGLMLDRIAAVDSRLRSYATVMGEEALAEARQADDQIRSGSYLGPLHGVPIAVKDLCYTQGVRTMGGSAAWADFVPSYDATVVRRLREAGAVLLGKLNLTEGAMVGYNPALELPLNPWDPGLWAGVSSSGSGVATAAGLCFASLGTDTGGSIRLPAMANGVVGLKPTYGRVSRYGVLALSESLDHVGPMTRTVTDAAVMLETIAGFDPEDPTSLREPVPDMRSALLAGVSGLRVGFNEAYATEGVEPGLVRAIDAALGVLEGQGVEIVPTEVPEVTQATVDAWYTVCLYEAFRAHAPRFPSRADEYGPYFRGFLERASGVTDQAYGDAIAYTAEYRDRFRAMLRAVDAIACPSGGSPFTVGADAQFGTADDLAPVLGSILRRTTLPASLAGTPTISLPCGQSELGAPYTIQFLGASLTEPKLCRLALGLERATTWHTLHPPV